MWIWTQCICKKMNVCVCVCMCVCEKPTEEFYRSNFIEWDLFEGQGTPSDTLVSKTNRSHFVRGTPHRRVVFNVCPVYKYYVCIQPLFLLTLYFILMWQTKTALVKLICCIRFPVQTKWSLLLNIVNNSYSDRRQYGWCIYRCIHVYENQYFLLA